MVSAPVALNSNQVPSGVGGVDYGEVQVETSGADLRVNLIALVLQRFQDLLLEWRIRRTPGLDRNIENPMLRQLEKGLQGK
jgi:hypothetical protein